MNAIEKKIVELECIKEVISEIESLHTVTMANVNDIRDNVDADEKYGYYGTENLEKLTYQAEVYQKIIEQLTKSALK